MSEIRDNALMAQGPRDINDDRNFTMEIQKIENNQALSVVAKFNAKRQLIIGTPGQAAGNQPSAGFLHGRTV